MLEELKVHFVLGEKSSLEYLKQMRYGVDWSKLPIIQPPFLTPITLPPDVAVILVAIGCNDKCIVQSISSGIPAIRFDVILIIRVSFTMRRPLKCQMYFKIRLVAGMGVEHNFGLNCCDENHLHRRETASKILAIRRIRIGGKFTWRLR